MCMSKKVGSVEPLFLKKLCRVLGLRHTANKKNFVLPCAFPCGRRQIHSLPCAHILPSVCFPALGKWLFCRVPKRRLTAKSSAHGNLKVSGSGLKTHHTEAITSYTRTHPTTRPS